MFSQGCYIWAPSSSKLLIIFVYAPQELTEKREIWGYLHSLINRWDGKVMILGDFNEVWSEQERFGSSFNSRGANAFNNFIATSGLIDLPLGGYSYTWAHKSASKMSKQNQFLISEGLMVLFPHLSGLCLDRKLSDHRPIIMCELNLDYGPTPFRMCRSWFNLEGFDCFLEDSWHSLNITDSNALTHLNKKFRLLKNEIKSWVKHNNKKINEAKSFINCKLTELDKIIDQGGGNEEIVNQRANDVNSIDVSKLSQKAKVRWSIEGDENSKYFHGILNSKRSQLAIRGILLYGDWIADPNKIKMTVWDCGTNKSPGPYGFTFEFYRNYWNILDQDIVVAVYEFFASDFCPISVIGSIYKIVAKIMANRLCSVMPILISDVQTTFISNRQILDGPFILNELLAWYYLDDVLKSFDFGGKWHCWIFGCLNSAKGSILINGSPTPEFQFHKGLKQDDVVFVGKWDISDINTIVHEDVTNAASIIGCATFSSPFNYLGVKLKTLSTGGRITLIKLFLAATPLHHMSLYKAPIGILNSMKFIRRDLFNGIDTSEKKIAWVELEIFLSSKKNGDLGVSSFYAINRGLLFKWVCHFITQDASLWYRLIKAIHGVRGVTDNHSSLKRLFALESRKDITLPEKLRQSSYEFSFRRSPRGGLEEEQYNGLCSMILDISLPNMSDRWFWSLDGSGEFSVRSVRCLIDDALLPKSDTPTRWVKLIPIKVNVLAWKICLDRLPTRLNLSSRGLEIPSILCPLCNDVVESSSHLFFSCSLARQVLRLICRWWELEVPSLNSYIDWLNWLSNTRLSKLMKEILEGTCYVSWWIIWRHRNQCLFGSHQPRRDLIFDDIIQMSFLWISCRCKSKLVWDTWIQNPNFLNL
ncbi:RNA-directed DNA polymerase, eukaryota [Tanacetum coccineum]